MRASALISIAMVIACTDARTAIDPDATALEIVVELAPGLGVDSLRISTPGTAPAFAPGTVPESPRPLAGSQSAVVLLPDSLDGTELVIRVDGLAGATIVASGGARVTVQRGQLQRVDVALGEPAVCGDSQVADPIEACDDGDLEPADGCADDCSVEPDWACTSPVSGPSICKPDQFDVIAAASTGNRQVTITFSDPPDPVQALVLASYTVPGLTLSGPPFLSGNQIVLATSSQIDINYNVIVAGVTRARDAKSLSEPVAGFAGRTAFNLMSARSISTTQIEILFSEPPDAASATVLASYAIPGLTLSGTPALAGDTVTITTSTQAAQSYAVTVSGVRRASDGEPLTVKVTSFTGVNGFDITAATATSNRQLVITFNAPPNTAQAATLGNYSVSGLTLSGTPIVAGTTVTLQTSSQSAIDYTVTVANVGRASDGQPLTIASAQFTGQPITKPTVTDVDVVSTAPNNGTTFYNTGSATVRLTGTQFATVACPAGVRLDDLDGGGAAVSTQATSCTVDSDTQITATFPAGIRTNRNIGWNVIVTNSAGSNVVSDKLVVRAGLLISEVLVEAGNREFVELYNPTATSIDASALGLHMHIRSANGVDSEQLLTFLNSVIPSRGFLLIASSTTLPADPWFANRDATYSATGSGIGANGGVYVSLSATSNLQVLDKVGWGTQPAGGFEGTPLANIPNGESVERKPAGGAGHAVDTDVNASDFHASSTVITPRGTASPRQP